MARGLYDEPVNKPYRKFEVDEMPIIEVLEKLDYQELLTNYQEKHGKELKPIVRRRNSKTKVPKNLTCPKCVAPSTFIYANNGNKGQYQCKVVVVYLVKRIDFLRKQLANVLTA